MSVNLRILLNICASHWSLCYNKLLLYKNTFT